MCEWNGVNYLIMSVTNCNILSGVVRVMKLWRREWIGHVARMRK